MKPPACTLFACRCFAFIPQEKNGNLKVNCKERGVSPQAAFKSDENLFTFMMIYGLSSKCLFKYQQPGEVTVKQNKIVI